MTLKREGFLLHNFHFEYISWIHSHRIALFNLILSFLFHFPREDSSRDTSLQSHLQYLRDPGQQSNQNKPKSNSASTKCSGIFSLECSLGSSCITLRQKNRECQPGPGHVLHNLTRQLSSSFTRSPCICPSSSKQIVASLYILICLFLTSAKTLNAFVKLFFSSANVKTVSLSSCFF